MAVLVVGWIAEVGGVPVKQAEAELLEALGQFPHFAAVDESDLGTVTAVGSLQGEPLVGLVVVDPVAVQVAVP